MPTRKKAMKVYLADEEYARIVQLSEQCGLSMSEYGKRSCLGQQLVSVLDQKLIRELIRINGDLGRLGGLLKMWLTNEDGFEREAQDLLESIQDTKHLLHRKILQL